MSDMDGIASGIRIQVTASWLLSPQDQRSAFRLHIRGSAFGLPF